MGLVQDGTQPSFGKPHLDLFQCPRLLNRKVTHTRAAQLGNMCADAQPLAEIFCQRANVSACRTCHSHFKIEGAVEVIFQQLTSRFNSFERMNADSHRLSFYLFTLPRQFVKSSPSLLLRGIHWRHLINIATQTLECGFDFVPAPWTT